MRNKKKWESLLKDKDKGKKILLCWLWADVWILMCHTVCPITTKSNLSAVRRYSEGRTNLNKITCNSNQQINSNDANEQSVSRIPIIK